MTHPPALVAAAAAAAAGDLDATAHLLAAPVTSTIATPATTARVGRPRPAVAGDRPDGRLPNRLTEDSSRG